jgi:hypothetical protein
MDPLTSLVTALAAGAGSALQSTVEQVVKDTYAALKGLIQRKYTQVNVTKLVRASFTSVRNEADLAQDTSA